ncbi:HAD-IA family hydrolase [Bacillus cereus]|uniref:HAD-IA family hydrolase n=1 Tax=Bacillus cereus TaxID=1396 RepID=UPI0018F740F7|nr:HAD-IA family hydrolase [Bacillus cereus]MBJ8055386.1 HAD-IA family hydrolase [Bacillus cereus]
MLNKNETALHKPKKNVVLFDIGDTLLRQKQSFNHVVKELFFDTVNDNSDFDIILKNIITQQEKTDDSELNIWNSDQSIQNYLYKIYYSMLKESFVNPHQKSYELISYIQSPNAWTLINGAKDILIYLKNKGFIIGVVSNWDSGLENVLQEKGLCEYFDIIVSSAEVGYEKPDCRIFYEVYKKLAQTHPQIDIDQVYMIGDSFENDVYPSIHMGFNAILISNNNKSNNIVNNYFVVENLNEIKTII